MQRFVSNIIYVFKNCAKENLLMTGFVLSMALKEVIMPRHYNDDYYDDTHHSQRSYPQEHEYRSRMANSRPRDESGRFMNDDDMGYNGRRSNRYAGEDYGYDRNDYSRGRSRSMQERGSSHGGWFGDPEGHSRASRMGWQNPDHGESGWYGDSRGHSEASRRGWQNSDHGDSGWYGDPEGHSEASRRGWEHGHAGQYRSARANSNY